MEYQFLHIDNIKLAFIEKNRDSEKLVFFVHGNSSSSEMWLKQFNDEKFSKYHLIALELPAHGKSDSLSINDYNLIFLARLLSQAIKKLAGSKKYAIVGFSLGANIVSECLNFIKPNGIVLASPTIIGKDYPIHIIIKPGVKMELLFSDEVDEDQIKQYFNAASHSSDINDKKLLEKNYHQVKLGFRPALLQSSLNGKFNDQIEMLKRNGDAYLIIFGEEDELCFTNYLDKSNLNFWQKKIFRINGGSHFVNIDKPKEFNNLLSSYLKDIL